MNTPWPCSTSVNTVNGSETGRVSALAYPLCRWFEVIFMDTRLWIAVDQLKPKWLGVLFMDTPRFGNRDWRLYAHSSP